MTTPRAGVVVPLKRFDDTKSRLRTDLDGHAVRQLAERLARAVILACAPRRCVVVGDHDSLRAFAYDCGAEFIVCDDGLNASAALGRATIATDADLCVVAHADLASPTGLGTTLFDLGVTIVPDRHNDGTNVLVVPTDGVFEFHYGPGSAEAHAREAQQRALPITWRRGALWSLDIDTIDDLNLLQN